MNTPTRDRSRKIQIQINESLNQQLSRAAERSGITKSAFVRVALEREFKYDQQLARECARSLADPAPSRRSDQNQPRLFEI